MTRWLMFCCAALTASMTAPVAPAQDPPPAFVVIVHKSNRHTTLRGEVIRDIFFKKDKTWPDGTPIIPVDLHARSKARQAFSKQLLNKRVPAVRNYWTQRLFSGVAVPPIMFASEQHAVRYVARYRGAIGYVSPTAPLDDVRVVEVR